MEAIKTDKLSKFYGKSRGIKSIDLHVDEGDIFGFIGPNGAGKSTTIRLLLGLISPTSGKAFVLGKDVSLYRNEILKNVGYMPSEAIFYGDMKVSEVIELSVKLRGRKKEYYESAFKLCERFNVDRDKRISELSLGNRKKVSIVCAFFHEPSLYILDEPTGGLDPLMQKEFWGLIEERNKAGATFFLSSHILHEIQRYCKNAAIVNEGLIISQAPVAELIRSRVRHFTVYGADKESIEKLPGAYEVSSQSTDSIEFLYRGDMKQAVSELNKLDIRDLLIREPDAEEAFMHFYEEDRS